MAEVAIAAAKLQDAERFSARAIEAAHDLPAGAIGTAAYEPSLLERALTGRISDETWRLAMRNGMVRTHGDAAGAAHFVRTGILKYEIADCGLRIAD